MSKKFGVRPHPDAQERPPGGAGRCAMNLLDLLIGSGGIGNKESGECLARKCRAVVGSQPPVS